MPAWRKVSNRKSSKKSETFYDETIANNSNLWAHGDIVLFDSREYVLTDCCCGWGEDGHGTFTLRTLDGEELGQRESLDMIWLRRER